MEYLPGCTLKKTLESRLSALEMNSGQKAPTVIKLRTPKKQAMRNKSSNLIKRGKTENDIKGAKDEESDDDEEGEELVIPEKFKLLELGRRLKLTRPVFTETEASQILKGILTGLDSVHEKAFIHRDIKPENMVLAPDWEGQADTKINLIDFGFSARYKLSKYEQLDGNIGTTLFMAPE